VKLDSGRNAPREKQGQGCPTTLRARHPDKNPDCRAKFGPRTPNGGRNMDDEERRKYPHRNLADKEVRSKAFHFVIKRQEMTADFDERQKQLFDQALIAILVASLIPDKLEQALAAARDTTISVFSGEMLADLRAVSNRSNSADSPTNALQKGRGNARTVEAACAEGAKR
jgi:hypothetical protein